MPPDRPEPPLDRTPGSAMYGRIWALAWPTLLYNVLELSLGVADLLMVRGLGFEATAAIGLTRQIAFLVEASALAVATGVIALVSQGAGAGDRRQVEGVMHQGTRLVLVLGPPITLAGYLLSRPLLVAMQADETALAHAVPYLHIYFLGTVFLWGTVIPAAIFRGSGDAMTPLKLASAVAVLNVPLNYMFIFGAGPWAPMGVAGAAVGTVMARAIGAGLYLVLLTRGTRHGRVRFRPLLGLDWPLIRRMLKIGMPPALSSVARNGARSCTWACWGPAPSGRRCTRRPASGCRCGWSACCRPWRSRSPPPPSWARPSGPGGSTGPRPWDAAAFSSCR